MVEFSKVKPIVVFEGQNDPAVDLFLRSVDGMAAGGVCPESLPEADVIAPDGYVTLAEIKRDFGSTQGFITRFRHFFPLLDIDFSLGKIKSRTVNIMAVRQALAEDALAATFNHRDVERVLSVVFFGGREELSFEEFKLVYFSWLSFCSDDVVAAERLLPSDLPPRLRETDQVLQPGDVSTEKRWQELFAVWKRVGEITQDLLGVPINQRIAIRVSCEPKESQKQGERAFKRDLSAVGVVQPDTELTIQNMNRHLARTFNMIGESVFLSDEEWDHLSVALAVMQGAFETIIKKYPEKIDIAVFEEMADYFEAHPDVLLKGEDGKVPLMQALESMSEDPKVMQRLNDLNRFLELRIQEDLNHVVDSIPGAEGWDLLCFGFLFNLGNSWAETFEVLERR